jgi:hypothetical protein
MDQLSVNFGIRNKNRDNSNEKEEKMGKGTYSVISSQNDKALIGRQGKRKSSFKPGTHSKKLSDSSYIHDSNVRNKRAANGSKVTADGAISFSFRSKDSIDPKS